MNADPPERHAHRRPLTALLFGASFLLWCALAALILQRYPPASWEHKVLGWVPLLVPIVVFLILALWFARRKAETLDRGAVLLELGPTQGSKNASGVVFLLTSLPLLGLYLWTVPPPGQEGDRGIHELFWWAFPFVWGIKMLLAASARTRITERGFRLGERLLPWNDIESWEWNTFFGLWLVLTLKKVVWCTAVWGSSMVSLSVPAEQKAAVERVLAEHLPAARTSPGAGAGQASLWCRLGKVVGMSLIAAIRWVRRHNFDPEK